MMRHLPPANGFYMATTSDSTAPQFLVFGAPLIEEAEIDEVVTCMRSGWLGTGPRVARFEHDFAVHLHGMNKDTRTVEARAESQDC